MVILRPGHLPASALRTVAPGTRLLAPVAAAFENLALVANMWDGTRVAPVSQYGSGYRDWDTALVFYRAGQGDLAARRKAGIDPHLKVSIAYPPGSHGDGTRIDMLFNGNSPTASHIALASHYGFTREFGENDRNHFEHDKRTAVQGVRGSDKLALTARQLNGRHLGRQTETVRTGKRDADFIWLVQHAGHLDHTYPAACDEDGVTGPNTERSLDVLWMRLSAAYRVTALS